MLTKSGVWVVRIRADHFHLTIPLPLYVLTDLLESMEDLCEVILPRFGLPNYAALLRQALKAIGEVPLGGPLVDVQTEDADVTIRRIEWEGRDSA